MRRASLSIAAVLVLASAATALSAQQFEGGM